MAAQKKTSNQAMPDGFVKADLRPKHFELEPGLEFQGTLGTVQPSKNPEMPPYRTIRTPDGNFYLPSHAELKGLMDFPAGTRVFCRFQGGNGKKNDAYKWDIGLPEGIDTDLPF